MLYRFIISIFIGLLLFPNDALAQKASSACIVDLMPCPQSVILSGGHFDFNQAISIYIEGMSNERKSAILARTQKQLQRLANLDFSHFTLVNSQAQADIIIIVAPNDTNLADSQIAFLPPILGEDENYQLKVNPSLISIEANSDFGAIHALSTLVQLVYGADSKLSNSKAPLSTHALKIPQLQIIDAPRFMWRGLLIDSVRHFIPVEDIKRQLDGMAAAKLNVFHWHLTDDQGWRVESKHYPKLHLLASDNLYYTQQEIKDVVNYASLLGIRVIPEFDVPGHASAIAVAYPELMAEKKLYTMERQWGVFEPVLDVSDPKVYQFIDDIVEEFAALFPDSYLHIGGDEVNPKQWLNNDDIKQLMSDEKLATSYDLHHFFNVKVQTILAKHDRKMMGWDEIYHLDLPKDIVIQSWRGLASLNMFASQDYQGVLSTGFYIDQPQYSTYHYRNDPITNIEFYESVAGSASNKIFSGNEPHRTWQLSIPRLKGSNVTGTLILAKKTNKNKTEGIRAYLKLNNNSFQNVTILTPLATLNAQQTLIFTMDSWMGPLRFELDLASTPNKANDSIIIGNAFYPLIAQEIQESTLPNIALVKKLSPSQTKNILGAEATLWSEMLTKDNIDLRTWPRLFVIAERLWSKKGVNEVNNMHQRLLFMDTYSDNILGLKHKKQMLSGFSKLLGKANTTQNMNALLSLAEVVEPAHYYTRHHIKYQQNSYHQLAPLTKFVDFLPVESYSIMALNRMISAYQSGDYSVLSRIKLSIKKWQENEKALDKVILEATALSDEISLINDVKMFNQVAMTIVEQCNSSTKLTKSTVEKLNQQLRQLQSQQTESVLTGIWSFQQLLVICQNMPIHTIDG